MSNLSRLRRRSSRSARQGARNLRYINNSEPKKIKEPISFLQYTLTEGDTMVIANPVDILPNWTNDTNKVHNDRFPNRQVKADKIALIYSQKKKLFMYITICDDSRTCAILFKNKDLYQLPDIYIAENNHLYHLAENSNRLMNCIIEDLWDITSNPIMQYKTSELFRK